MMTNTQTTTVKSTTQEPKKAKLVKGTKKQQAPLPCRPIYGT